MAPAHLYPPNKHCCAQLSCHLAGRQLPDTISTQQLSRAQVRVCHRRQIKGLVTSPSPDAEANGNSSSER